MIPRLTAMPRKGSDIVAAIVDRGGRSQRPGLHGVGQGRALALVSAEPIC
jgi:hypothetical protein